MMFKMSPLPPDISEDDKWIDAMNVSSWEGFEISGWPFLMAGKTW
jgi:hypothetical protein